MGKKSLKKRALENVREYEKRQRQKAKERMRQRTKKEREEAAKENMTYLIKWTM